MTWLCQHGSILRLRAARLFICFSRFCLLWACTNASATNASPSQGFANSSQTYSIPAFQVELHRISAVLERKPGAPEIAALRDSLPQNWTVSAPDHIYSISTQYLRNFLTSLAVDEAKSWIDRLQAEIATFSSTQSAVPSNARTQLNQILAKGEFGSVRAPSAWEILRQRIALWVQNLLLRLFGAMNRYPLGGKIIFWLAAFVAIVWIAYFLVRFWSRRDRMQGFQAEEPALPLRTWQEWLRGAREAAAQGNFREAVHSAYWAGIVRLQDVGVVPKDRTKTPREYLHLISLPQSGGLAPLPSVAPLVALTSRLERTWYANRDATSQDFEDSLLQLEALGCPLE